MINRLLYYKKIRMSIPEYLAYSRNEITLKDIYFKDRKIENIIFNNRKIKQIAILILAGVLILNSSATALAVDTSKIDNLGKTLLTLIQSIGYWFCIIMASKEILSALMESRTKDIGAILIKHILAFGGFYALPWCFDLIKELLG